MFKMNMVSWALVATLIVLLVFTLLRPAHADVLPDSAGLGGVYLFGGEFTPTATMDWTLYQKDTFSVTADALVAVDTGKVNPGVSMNLVEPKGKLKGGFAYIFDGSVVGINSKNIGVTFAYTLAGTTTTTALASQTVKPYSVEVGRNRAGWGVQAAFAFK